MATKNTKPAAAGEWETRVLGEFKASKSTVWRAQISKSPDGKEYAGIRKFIRKADGSEIADRSGITLLYDAGTLPEQIDGLIDLMQKLRGGKVKVKNPGPPYVLQSMGKSVLVATKRGEDRKLQIKKVDDIVGVKTFDTKEDADEYGERTVFKSKGGWKTVSLAQAAANLGIKLKKG